ncbi:MAG: hypothetical protein HGGPFJEG_01180 [Ignavibacteria bacterium]|nr:hypothetical protein [Ignavibacteria bacterium]
MSKTIFSYSQWQPAPVQDILNIDCFLESGSNLFAGTDSNGVYESINNGGNWTAANNGLTDGHVRALGISGNNIFAGTRGGVFISTNNGNSWNTINGPTNVTTIAISGNNMFVGTYHEGVYLSANGGALMLVGLENRNIMALAASGNNVFAGTDDYGIYLSTNSGGNWALANNGITGDMDIHSFAIISSNVFAGTEDGVFLSSDNGGSWTAVNNGLTDLYVTAIVFSGNNIFAGTRGGVFLSTNNGGSWILKNQGLSNEPDITALFIYNNYIFAGLFNLSVWRRSISEIIGIQNISSEIPKGFGLSQNYPNPFNPTTNIKFDISKKSFVNLVIYDLLGKEVATLVNENLNAGSYQADWNAGEFPSGVYFYRLQAEDFVQTKSMVLLK